MAATKMVRKLEEDVDVEGQWDMVTGQAANSEGDRERIERRCRQMGKQI
jgi:hypothetical protein